LSLLRKVQFVDFQPFLPQANDAKGQHKNKGKRLKTNKLKVSF